jgi:hypothetical protein
MKLVEGKLIPVFWKRHEEQAYALHARNEEMSAY